MFLLAGKKVVVTDVAKPVASNKISWVYHARGIAIMLIVYRHLVLGMKFNGVPVSETMYNLQIVFFNFRMPAFFILSGVFIAKSLKRKTAATVSLDKVYGLLYPYFVWAVITIVLQFAFSSFSNAHRGWGDFLDIFIQPRRLDQLWYLFALFNASMLFLWLNRFLKAKPLIHLALALGLHFLSFALKDYSLFSDFFYFYFFFLSGALLSDFLLSPETKTTLFKNTNLLLVLPFFIIGQWFWFMEVGKWYWIYSEKIEPNNGHTGLMELLFMVVNFVGCYVLFKISMLTSQKGKNEWLAYIGTYSLYIYILHVQVAAIVRKIVFGMYPHVDPWLLLSICIFCGILVPILLVNGLRRWGFERLFTLQKSKW